MMDSPEYHALVGDSKSAENNAAEQARANLSAAGQDKSFLSEQDQKRFGLQVRTVDGKTEAFFRAGGKDNIVVSGDANSPQTVDVGARLNDAMANLETNYKVKFAKPGEAVDQQITHTTDCKSARGEMIYAKQPTFSDVYAMKEALEHSSPSHTHSMRRTCLDQHVPRRHSPAHNPGNFRSLQLIPAPGLPGRRPGRRPWGYNEPQILKNRTAPYSSD